jgi:hypothetical protein
MRAVQSFPGFAVHEYSKDLLNKTLRDFVCDDYNPKKGKGGVAEIVGRFFIWYRRRGRCRGLSRYFFYHARNNFPPHRKNILSTVKKNTPAGNNQQAYCSLVFSIYCQLRIIILRLP